MNAETQPCQNCKNDFIIEPDDFGFYQKIKVPPPTFCPACRRQRRYAWRNTFNLYSRKCVFCDKSIVSIYSPDSLRVIYCNKCWWKDNWDPKSYGKDYDFSKNFFTQFNELLEKVPTQAIVNDDGIASLNCEYTQDWWFSKNCYMAFSGWYTENVMYSFFILAGKDIMDAICAFTENQWVYEAIHPGHCYQVKYIDKCRACIDSQFLYDCKNCSDCLMCTGLVGKQYHYKNKPYAKEEYEKILEGYKLDTWSGVEKAKKEFDEIVSRFPRRFAFLALNKDCTGDVINRSKNVHDSFWARADENCRFIEHAADDKDCYDVVMTGEASESYESITVDNSQLNRFGIFSVKSQDVQYTQNCHNCKYCFGCVGLRDAKYCILNKQYTKEEHETLLPKVIEQMNAMPYKDKIGNEYRYGEFYPTELSPFAYNESMAPELIPLTKEEALDRGFKWQDNFQKTIGKETLKPDQIPDSINDVSDEILKEVLACSDCERNYKIIPNELIFYRKMHVPIPRRCFYCRHAARRAHLKPFKLWHRKCMCGEPTSPALAVTHAHVGPCPVEFETAYSPEGTEIVYCEKCYQKEVY